MRELIESIVKALVDDPVRVEVRQASGEKSDVFEVRVAKSDVGKVIGRHGRTAQAMRTILGAVAMKDGRRYSLEILE